MLKKLVIAACALSVLGVPAHAQWSDGKAVAAQGQDPRDRYTAGEARDLRRQGDVVPALRVISAVRQRYPGADVLDAELEGGANPRYVIKILTADGRRIDVIADARTGQILYER
ncbi:PepSY domain-containing protein [Maricaulis sp. CAU 1757]